MAKIIEEALVIKFSKIAKNSDPESKKSVITKDVQQAIEQVAQELAGDSVVVEVEVA